MTEEYHSDLRYVSFEGRHLPEHNKTAAVSQHGLSQPSEAPIQAVDGFVAWVLELAGLDPAEYRPEPLIRRLPACLRGLKVKTPEEAQELLERRPELMPAAVSFLLIGVTDFFRDGDVFEFLKAEILPQLHGREGQLRFWSVGCANGSELYSVAILLAQEGLLERSFLLGTDCRGDAISQARDALYEQGSIEKMAPKSSQITSGASAAAGAR